MTIGHFFLSALLGVGPLAHQPEVKIHGIYFQVEIARTSEEWQKGLMGRERLGTHEGMLFVAKSSRPRSFWMKNTFVPLDILFISQSKKILNIQKGQPLSEASLPSDGPARYVLEILQGQAEAVKAKKGDTVEFYDIK